MCYNNTRAGIGKSLPEIVYTGYGMQEEQSIDRELREFLGAEPTAEQFLQFQELMMRYESAIREVRTKFEVLNAELSLHTSRNPIESIQSRVKKPLSIIGKLRRQGLPLTLDSIVENLNDVAGIRVICSFIDDIYSVAEMLARQDDVTVVTVKDYIRRPKPNGYRSYHMIVELPVFFSREKKMMRVEIQLRTVAMDFWASLEHQMKYKKANADRPEIAAELKSCAETIAATDARMMGIRKRIEKLEEEGNGETDFHKSYLSAAPKGSAV